MRSIEEQMKEISERKKRYETSRRNRELAFTGAGLLMSLVLVISIAPNVSGFIEQNKNSVLGSTILGAKTGGFVLVAVIAFSLGICVTILCRNYVMENKRRNRKNGPDQH